MELTKNVGMMKKYYRIGMLDTENERLKVKKCLLIYVVTVVIVLATSHV